MSSQDEENIVFEVKNKRSQSIEDDLQQSQLQPTSKKSKAEEEKQQTAADRIDRSRKRSRRGTPQRESDTHFNLSESSLPGPPRIDSRRKVQQSKKQAPPKPTQDEEISIFTVPQNIARKPIPANDDKDEDEVDMIKKFDLVKDGDQKGSSLDSSAKKTRETEEADESALIHSVASKKVTHDSNKENSTTLLSNRETTVLEQPITLANLPTPRIPTYAQIVQGNQTLPLITNPNVIPASTINIGAQFNNPISSAMQGMGFEQQQQQKQAIMRLLLNQQQQQQLQVAPFNISQPAASFTNQFQNTIARMPIQFPPFQLDNTIATTTSISSSRQGPLLYISTDDEVLSEYQILLRKQIEFFEAPLDDVGKTTSGRRRPTMINQVGIRCRHCRSVPAGFRQNGSLYYPAKLSGIYQAAQNMAVTHLVDNCHNLDENTRKKFRSFQQQRSSTRRIGHGGKRYWAESARAQGVEESRDGYLVFSSPSSR